MAFVRSGLAVVVGLAVLVPTFADEKPEKLPEPLQEGVLARMDPAILKKGGPVLAVAYSPDGKLLATASDDGKVRLWNPQSGKLIRTCEGHRGPAKAVAFFFDGKTVASGSADKDIILWNVESGKARRTLRAQDEVEAVAFSPDKETLATTGKDSLVRIWEVDSGKELRQLKGHQRTVHALAYSPDGKLLASAGRDRSVRFWDPVAAKELQQGKRPGWIYALSFSADGKRFAVGGQDQQVHIGDTKSGEWLHTFGGYEGPVGAVVLMLDGRSVAAGSNDHKVRLWEMKTGMVRKVFDVHKGRITSVQLAPDGQSLASAGEDGTVYIWDPAGWPAAPTPRGQAPNAIEMERLWLDLGDSDAERAYRAIGRFQAFAPETVAFFQERLDRLFKHQERVASYISDLDNNEFVRRAKATDELEQMGELAGPAIREALQKRLPLETQMRLQRLLDKIERTDNESRFDVRVQLMRTIEVLEHIGGADAKKLLTALTKGPPIREIRQEAKDALDRLEKRRT